MQRSRLDSNEESLNIDGWRCPSSHIPVARLTVALAWRQPPHNRLAGPRKKRWASALDVCACIVLAILGTTGVALGTTYLCGRLAQKSLHLQQQRYSYPQAPYSDVLKYASYHR
jgi:hypothetical protein